MIALHPSISLLRLDDLAIFLPSPTPQPRCLARLLLHLLAMTMFFWGKLNGALKIPTHPTGFDLRFKTRSPRRRAAPPRDDNVLLGEIEWCVEVRNAPYVC